ncbi:unnamed protein product [Effrenium voratum]|nr:unnamed protein product [Effrenium voratum]
MATHLGVAGGVCGVWVSRGRDPMHGGHKELRPGRALGLGASAAAARRRPGASAPGGGAGCCDLSLRQEPPVAPGNVDGRAFGCRRGTDCSNECLRKGALDGSHWPLALALFASGDSRRSLAAYNAAIALCEQWQQVVHLLMEMRGEDLRGDVVTYGAAISTCEKGEQWQLALCFFGEMEESSVQKNVISFNAAISACEKGEQWQAALALLSQLRSSTLQGDVISYNAAISACGKVAQWEWALFLLAGLGDSHSADLVSYNAAIRACEGEQWAWALQLMEEMNSRALRKDVITFNAGMSACEFHWQLVLMLLAELHEESLQASKMTYPTAIAACGLAAQWRRSVDLLQFTEAPAAFNAAIMACTSPENRPGVCNLCDATVNFVYARDSERRVRFGAIQKHQDLLERYGAGQYAEAGSEALPGSPSPEGTISCRGQRTGSSWGHQ